jgi:hypothetical protein
MDDTTWTLPRSPTFSERLRLTWMLFSLRLPMLAGWMGLLWSTGATVSLHRTGQLPVSLRIANASGRKTAEITIDYLTVTAT